MRDFYTLTVIIAEIVNKFDHKGYSNTTVTPWSMMINCERWNLKFVSFGLITFITENKDAYLANYKRTQKNYESYSWGQCMSSYCKFSNLYDLIHFFGWKCQVLVFFKQQKGNDTYDISETCLKKAQNGQTSKKHSSRNVFFMSALCLSWPN